jgi:hypothetical protein
MVPLYTTREYEAGAVTVGRFVGEVRVHTTVASGTRDAEGRRVVLPLTIEEAEALRRELGKAIALAHGVLEDQARELRRQTAGSA